MGYPRVLIVDDEVGILRLCQRLLEKANYSVVTTSDPCKAVELMSQEKFDLLVTDIRMPEMDGFELIAEGKKFQPDLPVLMMTGFGTIDTAIQALRRGVDGLLIKPFNSSAELVDTSKQILEESRKKKDAARLQVIRPLFDTSEILFSQTTPSLLIDLIAKSIFDHTQSEIFALYEALNGKYVALDVRNIDENILNEQMLPILAKAHLSGKYQLFSEGDLSASGLMEWKTLLAVPVNRDKRSYLFITARPKDQAEYSEADIDMISILARQSAVALENASLYTELREYIQKVEDSQRALVQAEKMAAVGRLVASVAHEVNNPLQSVRNCLHLASRDEVDPVQRNEFLDLAQSEINRLARTVQQMLEFYRPSRSELIAVSAPVLIEKVVSLIHPQLRDKKISLETFYAPDLPEFQAIPDQIQQVLFNLVINSIDAIDIAGKKDRSIWIDIISDQNSIYMTIEDSGPGIKAELADQVFEPFVSSKEHGTGLGLSVSYNIIEAHHGNLKVIPGKHGDGACFMITLPVGE